MTMTTRDKRIMLAIIPVVVLLGFWFLVLGPKRGEISKASADLASQQQRYDEAKAQADSAGASLKTFAADYTELVKLGKAIPTKLDMPSLMVQLESAARGTGIKFTSIKVSDRQAAPAATTAQPPAAPGAGNGAAPAAAGGETAQSAPGKTVENAGNSVNSANATSAKQEGTAAPGAAGATGAGGASTAAGLDSVPLDMEFDGSFFRLADFFHQLKRFVRVANERIVVRGRLLTIDSVNFKTDGETFPVLKAEVQATVYLTPVKEGATAGATPQSPAPPAATPTSGGTPPAPATPTATATP